MSNDIADPARAIPVLASLNIEESRRFYVEQLGFGAEVVGDYMLAKRDAMEIHFWLASDRIHPEHTSCYIRGGQVPALYEEFRAKGVQKLSDFAVRPCSIEEFYLHDPHGNLLRVGCSPEEAC